MDEDILQKLALRLVTYPDDMRVDKPQLLVGSIPDSLPIHVPFPTDFAILGTLMRGPKSFEIILDIPLSTNDVLDFYQHALRDGWLANEDMPGMQRGGFTHKRQAVERQFYFHNSGWRLDIQVTAETNAVANVRLQLDQDQQHKERRRQRGRRPDFLAVLPPLVPPEGASQLARSSGGGGGNVYSSATLTLQEALQIAAVVENYTNQLVQAGWTPLETELAEHSAWSTWQFRSEDDEEWLAAFYLFQLAGEPVQYYLHTRADLKEV